MLYYKNTILLGKNFHFFKIIDEINSNENTNIDEMLNKIPRNQRSKGYEQHYGRTIDLGFRFSF